MRIELIAVVLITYLNNVFSYVSNPASKSSLFRSVKFNSHNGSTRLYSSTRRKGSLMRLRRKMSKGLSRFGTNPNGVGKEEDFLVTNTIESEYNTLQRENELLRKQVKELELEKEDLEETCSCYQIVIENFEGEGQGATNEWYKDSTSNSDTGDEIGLSGAENEKFSGGVCPIEPSVSFVDALRDRAYWLVGLLAFQSCSGFILSRNEALLETHPVIIYFLTMLVGAGGNAGNQASVRVIRGLALGTLNESTQTQFLWRELKMAVALSSILSTAGFIRAIAFATPLHETIAVTSALALIVFSSICLGAVLPLFLKRLGIDPAHSSTTIQVVMDILGVLLTVVMSTLILDSPAGKMLFSILGR